MEKEDYFVQCPFYKKHDSINIRCEGVTKSSRIILQFDLKRKKDMYMSKKCRQKNDYKQCMIYQMLEKKYDKEG